MSAVSPMVHGLEIWWAGDSSELVDRASVPLLSVAALGQYCSSESSGTMGIFWA